MKKIPSYINCLCIRVLSCGGNVTFVTLPVCQDMWLAKDGESLMLSCFVRWALKSELSGVMPPQNA